MSTQGFYDNPIEYAKVPLTVGQELFFAGGRLVTFDPPVKNNVQGFQQVAPDQFDISSGIYRCIFNCLYEILTITTPPLQARYLTSIMASGGQFTRSTYNLFAGRFGNSWLFEFESDGSTPLDIDTTRARGGIGSMLVVAGSFLELFRLK